MIDGEVHQYGCGKSHKRWLEFGDRRHPPQREVDLSTNADSDDFLCSIEYDLDRRLTLKVRVRNKNRRARYNHRPRWSNEHHSR